MAAMKKHAEAMGTSLCQRQYCSWILKRVGHAQARQKQTYESRAIIIATGATPAGLVLRMRRSSADLASRMRHL